MCWTLPYLVVATGMLLSAGDACVSSLASPHADDAGQSGARPAPALGGQDAAADKPEATGQQGAEPPAADADDSAQAALPQPGSGGSAHPASNAAVEAALNMRISADLEDTPFSEVIKYFANATGIDIVLASHFDPSLPVTLHARSISLRTALEVVCEPLMEDMQGDEFDFLIRDGMCFIVPAEQAIHYRVYDCRRLLAAAAQAQTLRQAQPQAGQSAPAHASSVLPPATPAALLELIRRSIEPESWMENGGQVSATMFAGVLVVRHRTRVHWQIQELLDLLAAMLEKESS